MSPPVTACPDDERLVAFADGTLPAGERGEVERHLRDCAECLEAVALLADRGAPSRTVPPSGAEAPVADAPLLARGTALGRYVLLEPLGSGGMGVVYAAYDPELHRRVALKLMHPSRGGPSAEARARLQREAQALARLSHPNVVPVFDVGTWREQVFVAMEWVDGGTLSAWLAERPRTWREVVRVVCDAGRGLAAAHAAGLVHRDVKPDNIMVGRDGRARITDFGLARAQGGEDTGRPREALGGSSLDVPLTHSGALLGTPVYMAPEQLEGRRTDAHSDQFSLCVAAYEALHGERPFTGTGVAELCEAMKESRIRPPPPGRVVPAPVRRALSRGLSPSPDARFPSVEALVAELERDPARQRRRWLAAGAAVLAMAAAPVGARELLRARAEACVGAARLDGAWDGARREAVRRAFANSGLPAADTVARAVEGALDAYAARWTEARREACVATHVERSQPERMLALRLACLDRAREDLRALAEVFTSVDAQVVERAPRASHSLPDLAACADWSALASGAPPVSPEQQPTLTRLQARLAEARALMAAGRYAAGVERARAVTREAREAGLLQAEAEAWLQTGLLEERLGEFTQAEGSLHEAALLAERAGDSQTLARARTGLVGVVGSRLERYDDGQRLARYAEVAVERAGGGLGLKGPFNNTLAMMEYRSGRYPKAREHFALAAQALEAQGRSAEQELTLVLSNLGAAQSYSGDYAGAMATLQRALALHQRAEVPNFALQAATWTNLGVVYDRLGREDDSCAATEQALALIQRALPPDHPEVANALHNTVGCSESKGDWEGVASRFQQAIDIVERTQGPDNQNIGIFEHSWGETLLEAGRDAEALPHLRRAYTVLSKSLGDTSPMTALALLGLGQVALGRGEHAEAARLLETAMKGLEEAEPRDGARARFFRARALWGLGRHEQARRMADEARTRFEKAGLAEDVAKVDAWKARPSAAR
ncbi:tetratricopeptide repeat protein [Pyxidicoccus fallax]|uniref:Tetratricopeptide repeat protein n=1 Tax=Pyxidicoccus fallax TaxID=394095 RepID=A0A848LIB9_9BACT|nr:tetratricopeptide repeat protein [Pyxidicoccus fallax]NMO17464.1 tetratricopeptide repeat protein [Pyxidicoccus fallax]NPC80777.1 tetratricopeptide repeat protein [Pyxidicoccus fallax]